MFRVARLSAVPICELVQSRDGQQWTIWTATACAYACMKPADFPITYLRKCATACAHACKLTKLLVLAGLFSSGMQVHRQHAVQGMSTCGI